MMKPPLSARVSDIIIMNRDIVHQCVNGEPMVHTVNGPCVFLTDIFEIYPNYGSWIVFSPNGVIGIKHFVRDEKVNSNERYLEKHL